MLIFLALACIKDTNTDVTAVDDTAADDTGIDDTGIDDTGSDNSCQMAEIFGTVLGINNTKEDVAVPLDCLLEDVESSQITNVTLDGNEAEWVLDGQTLQVDTSTLNNTGVLTVSAEVLGETLSTTFRAHSLELNMEQPEGLFDLGDSYTGGLTLLSESEADLVLMSDDQLVVVDRSGKAEAPCDMTVKHGICQYGRCFASASGRGFYGTDGASVVSVEADSCLSLIHI